MLAGYNSYFINTFIFCLVLQSLHRNISMFYLVSCGFVWILHHLPRAKKKNSSANLH